MNLKKFGITTVTALTLFTSFSGIVSADSVQSSKETPIENTATNNTSTYKLTQSDSNTMILSLTNAKFIDSGNNEILVIKDEDNQDKIIDKIQKNSELNYEVSETQIKLTKNPHARVKRGKIGWKCVLGTVGGAAGAGIAAGLGTLSAPVTLGAGTAAGLTAAAGLAGAADSAAASCFG